MSGYLKSLEAYGCSVFQREINFEEVTRGAVFSKCEKYRYALWRIWDPGKPNCTWIMLNPSTASHEVDDPTIKKCMKFAKRWGFGSIDVVNLFGMRATDPRELKLVKVGLDAIGSYNDSIMFDTLHRASTIIAAWGQNGKLFGRAASVKFKLDQRGYSLMALKLSKDGTPYHPLYLRDDSVPFKL